jgi:methionine-gamma-lyase
MGTTKLVSETLPRFGIETTVVDQTQSNSFAEAIRPNTRLIIIETPANPTLTLTDIKAVTNIARSHGIVTLADNTFATPLNQQPLSLGVDIVCHSATKYLGGHADLTAGVIVASKAQIESIWQTLIVLGPVCSPMDAWLLLRGLRTLPLRVDRQNKTAYEIAKFLQEHPKIETVFYPALPSHQQYEIAQKQMKAAGGLMAVAIKGDYKETERFVSSLKLFAQAVSLGGVESLIVHAAAMWGGTLNDEEMKTANIAPNLVRISIGLEHPQDLIGDLEQALNCA